MDAAATCHLENHGVVVGDNMAVILNFLHDKNFLELRRMAREDFLIWNTFKTLPMPQGYTAEETWRALVAIRRQTAHVLPIKSFVYKDDDCEMWCSTGGAVGPLLEDLLARGQSLNDETAPLSPDIWSEPLARDIVAAMRFDGADIAFEEAHRIVVGQVQPTTPEGAIVANIRDVLGHLGDYARHRITALFVRDLMYRLSEGAEGLSGKVANGARQLYPWAGCERVLVDTCDMLEAAVRAVTKTSLIDVISSSYVFWDLAPLEAWNAVVDLVLRAIAAHRLGLPHAGRIPLADIALRWREGLLSPEEVAFDWWDIQPNVGEGWDLTPSIAMFLRLSLHELDCQDDRATQRIRLGRQLAGLIKSRDVLNHRQQDVLISLVNNGDGRLTIKNHMVLYGVSYGTGRSDLMGLATMGFLDQSLDGREMIFSARKDLLERLQALRPGA